MLCQSRPHSIDWNPSGQISHCVSNQTCNARKFGAGQGNVIKSTDWNFDELWDEIAEGCHGGQHSIHGPKHWKRVLHFGLKIAEESEADVLVVKLFALFHDSCRENDGYDPGHGLRGAEYAKELREAGKFSLDDQRFDKLYFACQWHTDQHHHDDVTIGTCWDADRLDLGRVMITPDPKYLNTDAAKRAAASGPDNFLE